jgi:hypothetical protein
MSDKQIQRIVEDSYDESKEDGLRSIVREFYSRRLLSNALLTWAAGIVFLGLAVFSAVQFFRTDQTRWQIAYAVIFVVAVHEFDVVRLFAFQIVHRHSIKREIKRLELRVTDLAQTLARK